MKIENFSKLGTILILMDLVEEEQMKNILLEHPKNGTRLGDVLLTHGIVNKSELGQAVAMQKRLRSRSRYKKALAVAELVLKKRRNGDTVQHGQRVVEKEYELLNRYTELNKAKGW